MRVQMSLRRHTCTHTCLETHEMRDMSFFLRHNIYCDACVYFFLGHYVVHLLLLGCVATHAFFMGHILKIMGWVWDLPYLDLGPKWVLQ